MSLGARGGRDDAQTTAAAAGLQKILDAWFDAWNANDLDRVMTFFAENALYRPGDEAGKVIGKFSYGSFRRHPLLLKQLGVPLPARA